MNQKTAEKIFKEYDLGKVKFLKKIEIGFTNKVYLINNEFIIKICEDESNEQKFEAEVFFYNFFKNELPVPKIKIFDKSKNIFNRLFMIYPKIEGNNLYSKWHILSNKKRKDIIKNLCNILIIINNSPYNEYKKRFEPNFSENWQEKILNRINISLQKIEKKNILSPEFIENIKKFINKNKDSLREQKLALVYWDAHFDNILVQDTKIVGILDFERTEISSIDFVLDIIKRMSDHPKKYMSEEFEKFAKKEDYKNLLNWFKEFYPELFKFKNLNKRIDLYSIEHDLNTLIWYPDSTEVKQMIVKTIGMK